MGIQASAAAEIRTLLQALTHGDEVRREAAIARLAVIGSRAIDRLLAAFESQTDRAARCAILRALEPSADPRVFPVARAAVAQGGDVALAGIGVLRGLLDSSRGTDSLDVLVATALDSSQESRLRIAALEVLQTLSASVRRRVDEALASDPDPLVRERLTGPIGESVASEALWMDVLGGRLPDDPRPVRDLLAARGVSAPLINLQRLVDAVRDREQAAGDRAWRAEWRALRGAIHQTLAMRGSRLALYDLRETLERSTGGLPTSFLAALQTVGDSSLLEPIASAMGRISGEDSPWRAQLAGAFRAIAHRERITRRHPAYRRIARRWPELAAELGGGATGAVRHS